jgi:hypothetical protein
MPYSEILPFIGTDQPALNAFLALASFHRSRQLFLAGEREASLRPWTESAVFESRTLAELRSRFAGPDVAEHDVTIIAICLLTLLEVSPT